MKSSLGVVVNFNGKYLEEVGRFISGLFDYPFKGQGQMVKTVNKDL